MKDAAHPHRILHVDLHPFFVAVERARDAALRGRPVIIGGDGPGGRVAAASEEAEQAGVRVGQSLAEARRRCPAGVVRPGDLESYARVSADVTSILLALSRRVERPSADEAFVDLSSLESLRHAVLATESLRDQIQSRLLLDSAFGLGTSRLAARIASRWARPRGLLLLLPQHEPSFVDRQPLEVLDDLPASALAALRRGGLRTLADLRAADPAQLATLVPRPLALRLRESLEAQHEAPIAPMAPPSFVQEELTVRDRSADRDALASLVETLAERAARQLAPFDLAAGSITVEVRRGERSTTRTQRLASTTRDSAALRGAARRLASPLLEPAALVRVLRVRFAQLDGAHQPQCPLFPELPTAAGA